MYKYAVKHVPKYVAYDHLSIYAVGDSPAEAIDKARRDAREPDAAFKTARVTKELAERIERDGWDGFRQTFAVSSDGWITDTTRTGEFRASFVRLLNSAFTPRRKKSSGRKQKPLKG